MGIIAADPMGRILRVTAVLCITVGVIALTDYFSLFRAIGVMCVALSPIVFAYGYFLRKPWITRVASSLIITGMILWFINADMGWQDRYCILSPIGC
ncbi:Uncharacterised protein [Streptococcus pneumoniae]|jgi:ABC-type Fe3+ transport system permease subunit|uniref:Uncharacterized protein n=3 Tax=Stutzerimonas TaxID=2901164 RepID=A0A0D7DZZ4_STUST|nr:MULTISPECIES: hypothetical protein [Stutzerimonas]WAD28894.1 hypothetical protein OS670_20635 [Pseudomonadaceae bacterium T75]CJL77647.1 Uncharacterised protein [Streptococcus pneumoniae]KIZ33821.1 hypothetical protein LO50_19230 [Stutzerimonas stutzeri]KZX51370.1 hypothetical protein A3710_22645 [Stutzerimonas frequens]MBA1265064.1 hypothetical protein [Stutzerimonas stutzeri]